jgi:cytochrome c2
MNRKQFIIAGVILVLVLLFVFSDPVQWVLNLTKNVDLSDPEKTGEMLVEKYDCRSCHEIAGSGGVIGPSLVDVTRRYDDETIEMWLKDPLQFDKDTRMPKLFLSDSEIDAIVAYLHDVTTSD